MPRLSRALDHIQDWRYVLTVRVLGLVVVALTCSSTAAKAQAVAANPPTEYPAAVVDRPILLLPGMTELDISLDLPTYTSTTVDAMGNTTTSRTSLGSRRALDVNVMHAVGTVELTAGVLLTTYDFAHLDATIETDPSGAASIGLSYYYNGVDRVYTQTAGYAYKWLVEPGRLALYGAVGFSASEISSMPKMAAPSTGRIIEPYASGAAALQLTPNLAVGEHVELDVPVSTAGRSATTSLGELTELTLGLQRWDFYAQFAIQNLTNTRLPFAAAGFTHRWF